MDGNLAKNQKLVYITLVVQLQQNMYYLKLMLSFTSPVREKLFS